MSNEPLPTDSRTPSSAEAGASTDAQGGETSNAPRPAEAEASSASTVALAGVLRNLQANARAADAVPDDRPPSCERPPRGPRTSARLRELESAAAELIAARAELPLLVVLMLGDDIGRALEHELLALGIPPFEISAALARAQQELPRWSH